MQAINSLFDAVHDFNASVPYGGVAGAYGLRLDEPQLLGGLLALLHPDLVPGLTVPHMAPDEAKQSVAALQVGVCVWHHGVPPGSSLRGSWFVPRIPCTLGSLCQNRHSRTVLHLSAAKGCGR